jgi:hypothetical protein
VSGDEQVIGELPCVDEPPNAATAWGLRLTRFSGQLGYAARREP